MNQEIAAQTVSGWAEHMQNNIQPGSAPNWLEKVRARAGQELLSSGLPTTRAERWKYTSVRNLNRAQYVLPDAASMSIELEPQFAAAARLTFVNGTLNSALSHCDDLPDGAELVSLSTLLREDPESIRTFLERSWSGSSDALANLNTALAGDGMVLRVAPGVVIEKPIHLLNIGRASQPARAINLRHLIMLGASARVCLIEQGMDQQQSEPCEHFWNSLSQCELASDAQLEHIQLQQFGNQETNITRSEYTLQGQAQLHSWTLDVGARLARHEHLIRLAGEGAGCRVDGVFLGDGRRHLDNQIVLDHQVPNCTSSQTWRGVLDDRSRGVFNGKVVVQSGADGTDASQSSGNLLLSPHAEVDTKPELEIYAEDVRCAHGATVGQMDSEQLFYLRSRGIPLDQARGMLIAAFCSAVFEDMPTAIRELIDPIIEGKLGAQKTEPMS